jgi:hypothetical protein
MKSGNRSFAVLTVLGLLSIMICIWWLWFEEATRAYCDVRVVQTCTNLSNNAQNWTRDVAEIPEIGKWLEDGVDLTDIQFAQLLKRTGGERSAGWLWTGDNGVGRAWDGWHMPLHFMAFTDVRKGVKMRFLRVWSVGRNGKNEKGSGDDISVEIPFLESIPFDPWRLGSQFKSADEDAADYRHHAEARRAALGTANGL